VALCGLAAIAVGGTVGTIFASEPMVSLLAIAKFVFGALGSVTVLALWAPTRDEVRALCGLWLAGATLSAGWALAISETTVGRPAGLATHPNHLGIVCVLGLGLALGFALDQRRRTRLLAVLACPVLLVGLLASGSRAALLGVFIVVPAVAAFSQRVQVALASIAVGAIAAVGVFAGVLQLPADTGVGRLFDASGAESNVGRIEHLERSVARYQRHPLTGEGFEFAQEAHNVYLQVLVGGGPLALGGLALVGLSVIAAVCRGTRGRSRRTLGDAALLAGMGGGYAGYLVAAAFQNILWDRYLWLYVALLLSLALRVATENRPLLSRPAHRDSQARPPDRPLAASPTAGRGASPGTGGGRRFR
jgi:O-antigen ligase